MRLTTRKRRERSLPRWFTGLVCLGAASLLVGGFGKLATENHWFAAMDAWADGLAPSESALRMAEVISQLGTPQAITIATVLMVLVLMIRRRGAESIILLGSTISATVVQSLLKSWVGRPRPDDPLMTQSGAFPSGHAFLAVAVYGLFAYFLIRSLRSLGAKIAVGVIGVLLVAVISYSRIVLGVHYVSDVIFGSLLGLVWLITGAWVTRGGAKRERGLRFSA